MAAYSWTKLKCTECTRTERVRGKNFTALTCFDCKKGKMTWVSFHCGPEKYAIPYGGKGAIYKNPDFQK